MNPYEPPLTAMPTHPDSVATKEGLSISYAHWPLILLITQGLLQIVAFLTMPNSPVGLETPTGRRLMFFAFDLRFGRDPAYLVFTFLGIVIVSVVLCSVVGVLQLKKASCASAVAAAASSTMLVAALILHFVVPLHALSWVSGVPSYFALTWLLWYSLSRNESQHRTVAAQNRS
jgi:hypothetical protein